MADPFLSEIRMFGFYFPPKGWALCNGQILPISQNQALYALLGNAFGGDQNSTFGLPNLQGQAPVHVGAGSMRGQQIGEYTHTLTTAEMPPHPHQAFVSPAAATQPVPGNAMLATAANVYGPATSLTILQASTISNAGNSQPHDNMQPYLVVNFCIALQGVFPSRT